MNTLKDLILSNENEEMLAEVCAYQEKLVSNKVEIPIWERQWLTIEEASEYSGIARRKLREHQTHRVVPLQYGWETKFTS